MLKRTLLIVTLLLTSLMSYNDSDIDGVIDSLDLCPNSSLDDLVNEDGCVETKTYWGSLTLQVGESLNFDESNETFNNHNFYLNYQYHNWSLSLSNAQQSSLDSNNNQSSSLADTYVTVGHQIEHDSMLTKFSLGLKIASSNIEVSTGENDYYASLQNSYFLNPKQSIFGYFSYAKVGDSPSENYDNTFGYSFGTAYMPTEHWYTSLSYDSATSIYADNPNYETISWFNSYDFLSSYYLSLSYNYGLDSLSFKHTFTLSLGANFD